MEDRRGLQYRSLATRSYRQSDEKRWAAAYGCAGVVGKYHRGETLGLASDMGVSPDTIENLAHTYEVYEKLCNLDDGNFRQFVRSARKAPFVYTAHFLYLYQHQKEYNLTDTQLLDLLNDIIQAEGDISARGLDAHIRSRYGDTRTWDFYGERAAKELATTLQQPDLPNVPETIGNVYLIKWKVEGKVYSMSVVAANPERAINISKKKMGEVVDPKKLKKDNFEIRPMGEVVTDSKHLLSTAHGWLGDQA